MIPIKISFLYCTSVSLRIINMYRHASGWPNSTTVSMRKLIIYIIFLSRGFASAQCPAITLLQMFHPQLLLDFKLVPTTTPPKLACALRGNANVSNWAAYIGPPENHCPKRKQLVTAVLYVPGRHTLHCTAIKRLSIDYSFCH